MHTTDFFLAWKEGRLKNTTLKPMGNAGLRQSELIWRKWGEFCARANLAWTAAQPAHVLAFCDAIAPRSASRTTSPVTVRRYWRVIHDLYAFAVASDLLQENPATAAKPIESERVDSMALSVNMWLALREGLPSGHTFKDRRNRLVLLLMMRAALTVREIISLTVGSVKIHDGSLQDTSDALAYIGLPLLQAESHHWEVREPFPHYTLSVKNSRTKLPRVLLLDPRTSKALHDWLEIRRLAGTPMEAGGRLILGDKVGTSIAPKGLYNICKAHIDQCLCGENLRSAASPNIVLDEGRLAHLGPNTLRNTCIAIWFNNQVPLEEIKRRCAFKDGSVVSRLQVHLNNPIPV